jgi:hypothetical protein
MLVLVEGTFADLIASVGGRHNVIYAYAGLASTRMTLQSTVILANWFVRKVMPSWAHGHRVSSARAPLNSPLTLMETRPARGKDVRRPRAISFLELCNAHSTCRTVRCLCQCRVQASYTAFCLSHGSLGCRGVTAQLNKSHKNAHNKLARFQLFLQQMNH